MSVHEKLVPKGVPESFAHAAMPFRAPFEPTPPTDEELLTLKMEELTAIKEAEPGKLPNFVFVIPDGNRRGAVARGLSKLEGHALGAKVVWDGLHTFEQLGIPNVGIWIWSEDNEIGRSAEERASVFALAGDYVPKFKEEADEKGWRVRHLGRKDRMPASLREQIEEAEKGTEGNKGMNLWLALDYNWQRDLAQAINGARKELAEAGFDGEIDDDEAGHFYAKYTDAPPVDLLIRTSGEHRTSGLGLLVKDAELVVINEFLPDVKEWQWPDAMLEYTKRVKRKGA